MGQRPVHGRLRPDQRQEPAPRHRATDRRGAGGVRPVRRVAGRGPRRLSHSLDLELQLCDVGAVARDLGTGASRIVTKGRQVTDPVVADWPRVGWGETVATTLAAGQASYYFAVEDVGSGQTYGVDLLAGVTSATLMNIDLSGTTLVWRLQTGGGSGEVLMRDLTGGTTQPVASGPGLSGGSIDGDVVVWSPPVLRR